MTRDQKEMRRALIFLTLSLILLVVGTLGLPFWLMGIDSDSFGPLFRAAEGVGLADMLKQDLMTSCAPSNAPPPTVHFLSMYRPLQQALYSLEWYAFGLHGFGYHMVAILFHAITTGSIFLLLYRAVRSWQIAYIGALLFAFFPAHSPALIGFSCPIIASYACAAVAAVLMIYRPDSVFALSFAMTLYLTSLMIYEMPFALPAVYAVYLWLFNRRHIHRCWWFFGVNGAYVLFRLLLTSNFSANHVITICSPPLYKIIDNIRQLLKPALGLEMVPSIIVIGIYGLLCMLIVVLWRTYPEHRRRLYFCCTAIALCSWAIPLSSGSARYIYAATPFIVALTLDAISFLSAQTYWPRVIPLGFVLLLGGRMMGNLFRRQEILLHRDKALRELAQACTNRAISSVVILNALHGCDYEIFIFSSGLKQMLQLLSGRRDLSVHHITGCQWYAHTIAADGCLVKKTADGYRFTVNNPDQLALMIPSTWQAGQSYPIDAMARVIIHQKVASWRATDFTIIPDATWQQTIDVTSSLWVTWDQQQWRWQHLSPIT